MLTKEQTRDKIAAMVALMLHSRQTVFADVISERDALSGRFFISLVRMIVDDENPIASFYNQFNAIDSTLDYSHALVHFDSFGDGSGLYVVDVGFTVDELSTAMRYCSDSVDLFVVD